MQMTGNIWKFTNDLTPFTLTIQNDLEIDEIKELKSLYFVDLYSPFFDENSRLIRWTSKHNEDDIYSMWMNLCLFFANEKRCCINSFDFHYDHDIIINGFI